MHPHGVTFNIGSAIFETHFSYHKDMWIAAADYYMYFYVVIIVLFPLTNILQLINFTDL